MKENHAKGDVLNTEIKENSSENMLDHIVSDPNAKNISKPTCSEGGKSLKKLRTLQSLKGTVSLNKSAEMIKIRIGVRTNVKNNKNMDMPPPLWRRVKSDEKGNKLTSEKKIINPKSVSINEEAVHIMSNTQLTGVSECKEMNPGTLSQESDTSRKVNCQVKPPDETWKPLEKCIRIEELQEICPAGVGSHKNKNKRGNEDGREIDNNKNNSGPNFQEEQRKVDNQITKNATIERLRALLIENEEERERLILNNIQGNKHDGKMHMHCHNSKKY